MVNWILMRHFFGSLNTFSEAPCSAMWKQFVTSQESNDFLKCPLFRFAFCVASLLATIFTSFQFVRIFKFSVQSFAVNSANLKLWSCTVIYKVMHPDGSQAKSPSEKLQNTPRYFKMVEKTSRYIKVIQDTGNISKYSKIQQVQVTPRYSKILEDTLRHSKILQDAPKYSKMLQYTPRYSKMLQNTPRYCKMLQNTSSYSKILQDTPR